MVEKGAKLGKVDHTFSRTKTGPNNVSEQVYVKAIDGIEEDTEYVFEIRSPPNAEPIDGSPITFVSRTYNTEKRISIPSAVIKKHDILPGDRINLHVFEAVEPDPEDEPSEVSRQNDLEFAVNTATFSELVRKINEIHEAVVSESDND